ncbi:MULTISPECIES: hypothetical protein [Erysipelothrix]|uniref:hypothetical protein n=1 Tax=Erysipelothrix TaxID=1647 RepID=UPI0019097918|nr:MULTISPECIES: hypothetical protein [Erysipelothrix]MBK2401742.1 hypothetical protein [Erysipelothrix sp. strain 2 (EsS2-6-Brazil)]MCG4457399.1 hypothetical protein [Erysipelothrix rhusiopathiae]MDE8070174.1 hypothetical protein [Erysipelothrix rhusiopathiae]MDE8074255.1 hypothetical protein [Erysipelothrix rhusiopathiae]MDE8075933.1 hypothetical protein [Erysipelothrix rhusiopathiae]
MASKNDLRIVVEGYTFPSPLRDTFSVKKIKYNAFAERTAKTMRIDQLGDVWGVEFTLPSLPETEYKKIADALSPFVVEMEFYNVFEGKRMKTTFYHSDLEVVRISQDLHRPLNIKFTGTEVI